MYIFLIVIHVIVCFVLILVILLQSGRGGGLSEAFGSGSTSTIFGTSASRFLQIATSVCAIIFLVTSLSLAVLSSRRSKSLMELERIKKVLPSAKKEEPPPRETKEGLPVQDQSKEDASTENVKEELPVSNSGEGPAHKE